MTLISFSSIQDGDEADDVLFNSRFSSILDVINGNIDSDNLANNAVTTAKIADNAVTAAKIPNNSITSAKIEAQQGWIAVTFQNNWLNYESSGDSTWNTAAYMKDSLGFVHLKGLVRAGTMQATMFTLPAGYRPLKGWLFAVHTNNGVGRVDVRADGSVNSTAGSNVYLGLDNIIFRAEQ